jgi:F-type H+-transporting ATPase subunit epsilon
MLALEIVTPEKIVYKNEVDEVIAQTSEGQISILPDHIGLVTQIAPGEIIIKKGSSEQSIAITGGFLQVANNSISILADYAERAEEIEVLKAQEAQKRAERIMKEKTSEKDFKVAEAELIKALTQLKIAGKRKRKI